VNQGLASVASPWWGDFSFNIGQIGRWRVGALTVSVQRQAAEWHICQQTSGNSIDDLDTFEINLDSEALAAEAKCHRHVLIQDSQPLQVLPALANRPVVTRPLTPFNLYPGQEVVLYVGTTVWYQLYAYSSGPLLLDIPIQRPSDTWFGQSTREGEVCYAARTRAILNLDDVPYHPFRAITPVTIANQSEGPLLLERLLLPIPHLSIFSAADGRLWTEALSILCNEDMRSAHLHLGKGAPAVAHAAKLLASPRTPPERGVFVRALGAIFG